MLAMIKICNEEREIKTKFNLTFSVLKSIRPITLRVKKLQSNANYNKNLCLSDNQLACIAYIMKIN